MFRDTRTLESLKNDFQKNQRKRERIDVGIGFAPNVKCYDQCRDLMPSEFKSWNFDPKFNPDGVHSSVARILRDDDLIQFCFVIGNDWDANQFLSTANRAGKFLIQEFGMDSKWPMGAYPVLLNLMDFFTNTRLESFEFRTIAECKMKVFRNPGYVAADALLALHDFPWAANQPRGGNGLYEGYKFVWNFDTVELSPLLWQVVKFLWEKEEKRASIEEVLEVGWGGTNADEDSSENKIRSAQNRLRQAFSEKKIPWRLTVKGEFLQLVEEA